MDDFIITLKDLQEFTQGKEGNRVDGLWQDFVERLPSELQEEARSKHVELIENPGIEEDPLAQYLLLRVPESSPELGSQIEQQVPSLICIKEFS